MAFQDRLKERREFLNMTRAELAKKLNITVSAIGNYENGISSPKTEILFNIFKALNCDANYLFQDEIGDRDSVSPETAEIAQAYEKADTKTKNIVKIALDINKEKSKIKELPNREESSDHIQTIAAHLDGELTDEVKDFIDKF